MNINKGVKKRTTSAFFKLRYGSEFLDWFWRMQNYLNLKTNPPLMSFNTELYEDAVQEPLAWIWVKLIILLAIFLIMPYLYVRFVEWRLLKFLEDKLKRQKSETS